MNFLTRKSLLCLVLLLIPGIVSGSRNRPNYAGHSIPHLCHGDDESSEECNTHLGHDEYSVNKKHLDVRFFFYKDPNNPDNATEIFVNDTDSVRLANPYAPSNHTEWKILIPGFPINGRSPFPQNVLNGYLERMQHVPQERYNILVVDWDKGPCVSSISFKNLTYTGAVGEKVGEMLLFLDAEKFLSLRHEVHIIGFSLGAHIAGEANRVIFRKFNKKNIVYRTTALDPSGNEFWERDAIPIPWQKLPRIRRSFVSFLDAIHTSKTYGLYKRIGDVDFFPNGGNIPPGCDINGTELKDFPNLCSHLYATELFAKSINDKSYVGCTGCDYFENYISGLCVCEDMPILGEFVDESKYEGLYPNASGVAFLTTHELGSLGRFGKRLETRLLEGGELLRGRNRWFQLCDYESTVVSGRIRQ